MEKEIKKMLKSLAYFVKKEPHIKGRLCKAFIGDLKRKLR